MLLDGGFRGILQQSELSHPSEVRLDALQNCILAAAYQWLNVLL